MKAEPQKEHAWLEKLAGEWSYENECIMGPDQPPMKSSGTGTVRALGKLWIMEEWRGEMLDGTPTTSILTLGYDPQTQRFLGTFVASMMTHMWTYDGALDASAKVLTLDTVGPSFAGNGEMSKYQDVFEVKSDDHRVLKSRVLGKDGVWTEFMTMYLRRKS